MWIPFDSVRDFRDCTKLIINDDCDDDARNLTGNFMVYLFIIKCNTSLEEIGNASEKK